MVSSDFPGYPLRYSDPVLSVPALPVKSLEKNTIDLKKQETKNRKQ